MLQTNQPQQQQMVLNATNQPQQQMVLNTAKQAAMPLAVTQYQIMNQSPGKCHLWNEFHPLCIDGL